MEHSSNPDLWQRFMRFVKEERLISPEDKVLLAVSGGADSVVMAHLFHKAGFSFGIAHCNFNLRGTESDADAAFVKALAQEMNVPFFEKTFDTGDHAHMQRLSIQMAARELRYEWFEEVMQQEKYTLLATAHHRDDSLETVILNLAKGSILQGLTGIPLRNDNIIRPLLFAAKQELQEYAARMGIAYREDSSNASGKYNRNLIRNQVVPMLEKINPDIAATVYGSSLARKELGNWLSDFVNENLIKQLTAGPGISSSLPIAVIHKKGLLPIHLYEWLKVYGFHYSEVRKIFPTLSNTEALTFCSPTHRLIKERKDLVVLEMPENLEPFTVDERTRECTAGVFTFTFSHITPKPSRIEFTDPRTAWLDAEKLQWPLILQPWQAGDFFYPTGFGKRKKLSDFFTDIKLSLTQKERQLVLCSGEDIIWVAGLRTDERFKVTDKTTSLLRVAMSEA